MKLVRLLSVLLILFGEAIGCTTDSKTIPKKYSVTTAPPESPDNGAQIARRECASCHGANGEGVASSGSPTLAHQWQAYLKSQLDAYATDQRQNVAMQKIAKALSEKDRADLATYYSNLIEANSTSPKASEATVKRGKILAVKGDNRLHLQSCNSCHGAESEGARPATPRLAGQLSNYTESQLLAWKSGARKSNLGQMSEIAKKLNARDIKAVAAYFATLQAP